MSGLVLHDYWRSGAAWRVRIALNLKGLAHSAVPHDLRTGAHKAADYVAIAPQGLVPALETGDGTVLTQSMAILEWLEERHPAPPLLPADPDDRAVVRAMAATIACDIHPLNNLRVLNRVRDMPGASPDAMAAWIAHWTAEGFTALETMVAAHGRGFAWGDAPTLADCCLVPQLYSAARFAVDLTPWPRLVAAGARAAALPAFAAAHPSAQPDADPA